MYLHPHAYYYIPTYKCKFLLKYVLNLREAFKAITNTFIVHNTYVIEIGRLLTKVADLRRSYMKVITYDCL